MYIWGIVPRRFAFTFPCRIVLGGGRVAASDVGYYSTRPMVVVGIVTFLGV